MESVSYISVYKFKVGTRNENIPVSYFARLATSKSYVELMLSFNDFVEPIRLNRVIRYMVQQGRLFLPHNGPSGSSLRKQC